MPEGPEVKRLVHQLEKPMFGQTLESIEVLSGRYAKHGDPSGLEDFRKMLPAKIRYVKCKGKFIYLGVSNDETQEVGYVWNTLGMSGGWSLEETKHSRVLFSCLDQNFYFNDMRNFGTMHFHVGDAGGQALEKKLKSLGPDLLTEKISDEVFKNRLEYYALNKTIAEALMNQKIFSGIGNYLKAEILYVTKIDPNRQIHSITEEEFSALNKAAASLIEESYLSGGSTFRVYKDLYGETGDFSSRFLVYGRKTDPQGNPVVKIKTKDGRTTHWVPAIQK